MSIFDRFFGRKSDQPAGDEGGASTDRPSANPAIENPLSLQLLFADEVDWSPKPITAALRRYHPDLGKAKYELAGRDDDGNAVALAAWGNHAVRIVGVNAPMPAEAVEPCVQGAHYGPELKDAARAHAAHALLFYAGYDEDPVEQYVALAAAAGALAPYGAFVVTNESGRTSFPAEAIARDDEQGDPLENLRALPLLILYCGFVKYEVGGEPGVWMRTHGCHLLGLPDLAMRRDGHDQGQETFDLFTSVLGYLRQTGAEFDAGHTMQVGDDGSDAAGGTHLRLRHPTADEPFLDAPGVLFVCEPIGADEANRSG